MTRRERLERRVERRREWSARRSAQAEAAFQRGHAATEGIPFGQPILVGHHSERRHRRAIERQDAALHAGVEHSDMARHHAEKATGLERQLERTIFDDDPDAIERLEERIAEREREAMWKSALNKAYRKGGAAALSAQLSAGTVATIMDTMARCHWLKVPFDTTNLRAAIRRDRERIAMIERQRAVRAAAEASSAGVVVARREEGYCTVTFAEKPERAVLSALRGAGYRWSAPSWFGRTADLPECVRAMEQAEGPV